MPPPQTVDRPLSRGLADLDDGAGRHERADGPRNLVVVEPATDALVDLPRRQVRMFEGSKDGLLAVSAHGEIAPLPGEPLGTIDAVRAAMALHSSRAWRPSRTRPGTTRSAKRARNRAAVLPIYSRGRKRRC